MTRPDASDENAGTREPADPAPEWRPRSPATTPTKVGSVARADDDAPDILAPLTSEAGEGDGFFFEESKPSLAPVLAELLISALVACVLLIPMGGTVAAIAVGDYVFAALFMVAALGWGFVVRKRLHVHRLTAFRPESHGQSQVDFDLFDARRFLARHEERTQQLTGAGASGYRGGARSVSGPFRVSISGMAHRMRHLSPSHDSRGGDKRLAARSVVKKDGRHWVRQAFVGILIVGEHDVAVVDGPYLQDPRRLQVWHPSLVGDRPMVVMVCDGDRVAVHGMARRMPASSFLQYGVKELRDVDEVVVFEGQEGEPVVIVANRSVEVSDIPIHGPFL